MNSVFQASVLTHGLSLMKTSLCELRGLNGEDGGHGWWDYQRSVFPVSHRTQRFINSNLLHISDSPWIYCLTSRMRLFFWTQNPVFVLDLPLSVSSEWFGRGLNILWQGEQSISEYVMLHIPISVIFGMINCRDLFAKTSLKQRNVFLNCLAPPERPHPEENNGKQLFDLIE